MTGMCMWTCQLSSRLPAAEASLLMTFVYVHIVLETAESALQRFNIQADEPPGGELRNSHSAIAVKWPHSNV